jgi:hypothetical protein
MQLLSKGRKAQEELQKQNGKAINEKVVHFADLEVALINARSEGIDPICSTRSHYAMVSACHFRGGSQAVGATRRLQLLGLT